MDDRGPERISDILGRLFTARGWARPQERSEYQAAWEQAVGEEYRAVSRFVGIKRRVWEIEVNGAVPLQELSQFHKRRILGELKKLLPGVTVSDLRFRSGSW